MKFKLASVSLIFLLLAACGAEEHREDLGGVPTPAPTPSSSPRDLGRDTRNGGISGDLTTDGLTPTPTPDVGTGGISGGTGTASGCSTMLQHEQIVTNGVARLFLTGKVTPKCLDNHQARAVFYLKTTNSIVLLTNLDCGKGSAEFPIQCVAEIDNVTTDIPGVVAIEIKKKDDAPYFREGTVAKLEIR